LDEVNKVVCVIENKIESKEHSNQLLKYIGVVNSNYHDYKKLFVYLTVSGEEPENEKIYIPFSYREVSALIDKLLERKQSQLNDEIRVFIHHYNEMIKKYIMEESDVQALCEQLYKKHKKALDLIFKHKPDIYTDISEILEEIIDENPELEKDHSTKSHTRFISKTLDFLPRRGEGWTKSHRLLLFEILTTEKAVNLMLYIGPGDGEIRQMLYDHVVDVPLFKQTNKTLSPKWASIYKFKLAAVSTLDEEPKDVIKEKLQGRMNKFFENDYKKIESHLLLLKDNF
jgi:hypothetical protein